MTKKLFIALLPLALLLMLPSFASAAATQMVNPKIQFDDANGDPCSGCKIFTYTTGTSTKKTTWTTAAKATPNANPIILDSAGQANIWIDGQYRIILAPSTDSDPPVSPIVTVDNVDSLVTLGVENDDIYLIGHNSDGTHKGYRLLSEFDSFADAVSTLGVTETNLWLDTDDIMTGDVTSPNTLRLIPIKGNTINVATHALLVGDIKLTWDQIFDISGGGTAKYGAASLVDTSRPEMWGAARDHDALGGGTDDADEIQGAIGAVENRTRGGSVQFASGIYRVDTELTVDNSDNRGIVLYGTGPGATSLSAPTSGFTGIAVIDFGNSTTVACTIRDMSIQADSGGNKNIYGLQGTSANGLFVERVWFSSLKAGAYFESCSSMEIHACKFEFNDEGLYLLTMAGINAVNCESYRNKYTGLTVIGDVTSSNANNFSNWESKEDGHGGDGSKGGMYFDTQAINNLINVSIAGDVDTDEEPDVVWPQKGIHLGGVTSANSNKVRIKGGSISGCKTDGIYVSSVGGDIEVSGLLIENTGYYNHTNLGGTFAAYGFRKEGNTGCVVLTNNKFLGNAGIAVYSESPSTILRGNVYYDNARGDTQDAGVADSAIGDDVIEFKPLHATATLRLEPAKMYGPGTASAGRNAITLNNASATPNGGNIYVNAPDIPSSPLEFATILNTSYTRKNLDTWDINLPRNEVYQQTVLREETRSGLYDFSVDGGAQGDIVLGTIPDNATVTHAWYEQQTAFTSGGSATVAFGVNTDDSSGILVATAYNNAIFNTGYHDATPDGTATNFTTKSTAIRNVVMTIATSDLTAGKVRLWWQFYVSE